MRREETTQQSYIDWLKSLGCVVYMPLTENDLTDYISGLSLQLSGNGSFTWDSNENMYLIKQPSTIGQYVGVLLNNLDGSMFFNGLSVLQNVKRKTTTNGRYCNSLNQQHTRDLTQAHLRPLVNSNLTGNIGAWPNGLLKMSNVYDGSKLTTTQNGNIMGQRADANMPSGWQYDSDRGLFIGGVIQSYFANVEYWLNGVYLFNNVLDLQTIRKIQGY